MTMIDQTSARSRQLESGFVTEIGTAAASRAIAGLNESYRMLSGRARLLAEDVEDGRREVRSLDLGLRTNMKAAAGTDALLEELAVDRGLGWSDIARLCGVSVSAVRKWRSGGSLSPERLRALAKLAAFLELLEQSGPTGEPTSWLMMPLVEGHTVSAAELYLAGCEEDILEHAQGHLPLTDMLNHWNPRWQAETSSEWAVAERPDGERIIVRRS